MKQQKRSPSQAIAALQRRNSLAVDVAGRLREAIMSGQFPPGERLREIPLATMLGVSRGPVREALLRLQDEGLVVAERHRGSTVARLSDQDEVEVRSLRLALERLAVQLAVRTASEPDLRALEALIIRLKTAFTSTLSTQKIAAFEIAFHDRIYRMARHTRLYRCWANLRSQIYIVHLSRNVDRPGIRRYSIARHQALLNALRARDEAAALRLVEEHVQGLGPADCAPREFLPQKGSTRNARSRR